MTRILTTILLLFGLNSFGQNTRIDTLIIPIFNQFTDTQINLRFPIVKTGNKQNDLLINLDIKNKLTDNEFPDQPIDTSIIRWAEDRVIFLDFKVTFNKNGILSLHIDAEGCGAYCTSWTEYLNYSTKTGKSLKLSEVVDTTGNFRTKIYADKDKQYDQQKIQLKTLLSDPEADFDEDSYNWTFEEYENCQNSFYLKSFALYPDHLEIIAKCYLPNVMKNLTPFIDLKYNYNDIKDYLKIKNCN